MEQNTSEKKVSIVLPVYNGEQFLSLSIESVLSQTYQNWVKRNHLFFPFFIIIKVTKNFDKKKKTKNTLHMQAVFCLLSFISYHTVLMNFPLTHYPPP